MKWWKGWNEQTILLLVIAGILAIRLTLAFSLENFTYESYFHLRQMENIIQTGFPLYDDPISYGGRHLVFLPLFHYLGALLGLFIPLQLVGLFLPNFLLALIPFPVYLICRMMTKDGTGSLVAAGIAGFLPALFLTNAVSPESLALLLVLVMLYAFLKLPRSLPLYAVAFLLAAFTSSSVALVILGFGFYLLLLIIEQKKISRAELEVILASVFFYLWSQFLFFKETLLQEGLSFIWKNIPSPLLFSVFPTPSIGGAILSISIIPLLTGIFITYKFLFRAPNSKALLFISMVISTILFSLLRIIPFRLGLAFVGVILAILFSWFYHDFRRFLRQTKLHSWRRPIQLIFLGLLVITIVYPALVTAVQQDLPQEEDIKAFSWLAEHTAEGAGVAALVEEGHLVTFFGKRKNLMDGQFRLQDDAEERYQASREIFTTPFETQAISLLNKYGLRYMVFTPRAKKVLNIQEIPYLSPKCFHLLYHDKVKIYEVACRLEKK